MKDGTEKLILADGNGVRFSLRLKPLQCAENLLKQADELLRCLKISLRREIAQMDDSFPLSIVLTMDYCAKDLEKEEFEAKVDKEGVILRARTEAGMFHAVYCFLERFLGARWLWPGSTGEVIPFCDELAIPYGNFREKPDFLWRGIQVGGAFLGGLDYNTALYAFAGRPLSQQEEFKLWCRRNRFGGLKVACGHRWSEIAPPEIYGGTHPEFYALFNGVRDCRPGDGKHGNQPCLSSPGVVDRMAEYACARFDAEPGLEVFSIALNDGGESCECEGCLAVDEQANAEGVCAIEHFDRVTGEKGSAANINRSVTDRLFRNATLVAEKVSEKHPDRLLLTQLYHFYRRPPVTNKLPENVIGQFCVMGNMFWDENIRDTELERIGTMAESVPTLGIYEYYSNGAWPEIHRLFPQLAGYSVREYYKAGARFFSTQPSEGFACNGLNLYVLGRALWNVDANIEEIIEDYCKVGFGIAAGVIKDFFEAFANRWKETKSGAGLPKTPESRLALCYLYDGTFLGERQKELDRAYEMASGNEDLLRRVGFVQKGLDYTLLYCQAMKSSLHLYTSAGAGSFQELRSAKLDKEPAVQAWKDWNAYWDFVRENEGTFVFGDLWVNYRPGSHGKNDPLIALLRSQMESVV